MKRTDIVGYTFEEQTYCASCIHDLSIPPQLIGPPERSTENILNLLAAWRGIQRHDENSFSTYRFPKPIYMADVSSADVCFFCGEPLLRNPEPNPK